MRNKFAVEMNSENQTRRFNTVVVVLKVAAISCSLVAFLAIVSGCSDPGNVENGAAPKELVVGQSEPVRTDKNVVEESASDRLPPASEVVVETLLNPDDPLDLEPAVKETKQVYQDFGLPSGWYQTLDFEKKLDSHGVFATAIWTMVAPTIQQKFQRRFKTKHTPSGVLAFDRIEGSNIVFTEVLLLSLVGPDHKHTQSYDVQAPLRTELPNIDPRFVRRDGSVDFAGLGKTIAKNMESNHAVDQSETVSSNDDEYCKIVGKWTKPNDSSVQWLSKQIAWRPVFQLEFIEGSRKFPGYEINGNRRLGMESFLQIGYRQGESQNFKPVHLAGPFYHTEYQPVGVGKVGMGRWEVRARETECPKNFFQKDLASLNDKQPPRITPEQKEFAEDPRPSAERPNLTSVGRNLVLENFHKAFHGILSPGKKSVPYNFEGKQSEGK